MCDVTFVTSSFAVFEGAM